LEVTILNIDALLNKKGMTKYRLSKSSGVPHTTVLDICSGKTQIEKCSGDTLYKLAKALDVSMETLIVDAMEPRPNFEWYKSQICHRVKSLGELDFIIDVLENDVITELWDKRWYAECLYLLAMTDYLSRENGLPPCDKYDRMRRAKLTELLFPTGVLLYSAAAKSDKPKQDSIKAAIPEFLRHNIVESEVRNLA
jgi:transcriptional regulator with XRE-family HTH domain